MDVVDDKNIEKEKRAPLNIGDLLIEARENKNLTSLDIAKQMNLTLAVILKIESNQFMQDIPKAFIRGYLRSYAQRVGLDVETICVEFDRQTDTGNEPLQTIKVVSNFKSKDKEINSSNWLFKLVTFVVFVIILSFGGWEMWKRFALDNDAATTQNSINLSTEKTPLTVNQNPDLAKSRVESQGNVSSDINAPEDNEELSNKQDLTSNDDEAVTTFAAAEINTMPETIKDEPAVASKPVINEPIKVLKTEPVVAMVFTFAENCWVQVTDANGEKIAYGTKQKGRVMAIKGVAPISMIIGEPSVVALEYEGQPYDLSIYEAGKSANFTIN